MAASGTVVNSKNIVSSVSAFWRQRMPIPVTTLYPGLRLNTASLPEWIELSFPMFRESKSRTGDAALCELAVTANCFAKSSNDKGRIHTIVDACRNTLRHQLIFIRDHDAIGAPAIGYVRFFEANLRFENASDDEVVHAIDSASVTFQGIAQYASMQNAA